MQAFVTLHTLAGISQVSSVTLTPQGLEQGQTTAELSILNIHG